tara:strand:+ start:555 stop:1601 length:1047 start_codon:yes stop_codon:yes gene_type:complete
MYAHLRPLLWSLEPELAHNIAIQLIRFGFLNIYSSSPHADLEVSVGDLSFPSPIGMAAGFDKNAEVFDQLFKIGFGFVEVGTGTPIAQEGNPKPRIFRLEQDKSLINSLGFNNIGIDKICINIANNLNPKSIQKLGINIGPNKDSKDRINDYVESLKKVQSQSDYVTINVSSPNTPNLRNFENEELDELLKEIKLNRLSNKPIFLKVSPDIENKQLGLIIESIIEYGLNGIVLTNTTKSRDLKLESKSYPNNGGLSGKPLFGLSNKKISFAYGVTKGEISIIGVGGIFSGEDAYKKIKLGANLVQLYTSFVYEGPGLIKKINSEIVSLMKKEGVENLSEIVGENNKLK